MSDAFDLAVRGGLAVTPRGRSPLDIYVRDGKVAALETRSRRHQAATEIDAQGLLVLPGMVDTHVHLMEPGDESREDYPSGTAAAVGNGVTTIVEHTHGWPVTSTTRLTEKREALRGRSYVDFGLAAHVWPDRLVELPALWRAGVSFFKIFTCETHGVPAIRADLMPDVLGAVADIDAACLVHCEDDLMTARAEKLLREAGRADPGVLPEWRSREAELVATGTVALLARLTGARTTIAHVSNAEALAVLAGERRLGSPAVAETCPQYLFLREDEVLDNGALRKFTPPARIRSQADADAMWAAFNSGTVHHLSTDHAPSTAEQKRQGDIWTAHFGLPGLDTTFPLILDAALTGRTSLERVVEAYARAPAQRYRLAGKGRIAPGADADLVLIDPAAQRTLADADVRSKAGWTPYAGRNVQGQVITTMVRGSVVVSDGKLVNGRIGRFLPGPGFASGG
jgi:dihydroorotase (multifunctional complex type)